MCVEYLISVEVECPAMTFLHLEILDKCQVLFRVPLHSSIYVDIECNFFREY